MVPWLRLPFCSAQPLIRADFPNGTDRNLAIDSNHPRTVQNSFWSSKPLTWGFTRILIEITAKKSSCFASHTPKARLHFGIVDSTLTGYKPMTSHPMPLGQRSIGRILEQQLL